jgi:hypothetical protein
MFGKIPHDSLDISPLDAFFDSISLEANPLIEGHFMRSLPSFVPAKYQDVARVLSRSMYLYQGESKDLSPVMGMASTTTGIFASIPGFNHETKAVISIALCERYGGVKNNLQRKAMDAIAGPQGSLYGIYFGKLMSLLGWVYPTVESTREKRIDFTVVYRRSPKAQRSWNLKVDSSKYDLSDALLRDLCKTSDSVPFKIST